MPKLTITYDGQDLFECEPDELDWIISRTDLTLKAKFPDITERLTGSILDDALKAHPEGVYVAPKLGIGFKDLRGH